MGELICMQNGDKLLYLVVMNTTMVVNCIMLNKFENYNLTPIVIKCMFNVIKYNKNMIHSYNKPTKYVALNNETLKYLQNIDGPNC